eukprot:CFRG6988T1
MASESKRYERISFLHRGRFGCVTLVRSRGSNKLYAAKESNLSNISEHDRLRLLDEVATISKLNHPHIARCKEAQINSGSLWLVMEYAPGGNLKHFLRQNSVIDAPLSEQAIVRWGIQLCSALAYIHKKGFVHRDIKSANVLVFEKLRLKIGDFGVAKEMKERTLLSTLVGTPHYMSPELCRGEPYGVKTDVWSLGCVLYEICNGAPPFTGSNFANLMTEICSSEITFSRTDYSNELIGIVKSMMHPHSSLRPKSMTCENLFRECNYSERRESAQKTEITSKNIPQTSNHDTLSRARSEPDFCRHHVKQLYADKHVQQIERTDVDKVPKSQRKSIRRITTTLRGTRDEAKSRKTVSNVRTEQYMLSTPTLLSDDEYREMENPQMRSSSKSALNKQKYHMTGGSGEKEDVKSDTEDVHGCTMYGNPQEIRDPEGLVIGESAKGDVRASSRNTCAQHKRSEEFNSVSTIRRHSTKASHAPKRAHTITSMSVRDTRNAGQPTANFTRGLLKQRYSTHTARTRCESISPQNAYTDEFLSEQTLHHQSRTNDMEGQHATENVHLKDKTGTDEYEGSKDIKAKVNASTPSTAKSGNKFEIGASTTVNMPQSKLTTPQNNDSVVCAPANSKIPTPAHKRDTSNDFVIYANGNLNKLTTTQEPKPPHNSNEHVHTPHSARSSTGKPTMSHSNQWNDVDMNIYENSNFLVQKSTEAKVSSPTTTSVRDMDSPPHSQLVSSKGTTSNNNTIQQHENVDDDLYAKRNVHTQTMVKEHISKPLTSGDSETNLTENSQSHMPPSATRTTTDKHSKQRLSQTKAYISEIGEGNVNNTSNADCLSTCASERVVDSKLQRQFTRPRMNEQDAQKQINDEDEYLTWEELQDINTGKRHFVHMTASLNGTHTQASDSNTCKDNEYTWAVVQSNLSVNESLSPTYTSTPPTTTHGSLGNTTPAPSSPPTPIPTYTQSKSKSTITSTSSPSYSQTRSYRNIDNCNVKANPRRTDTNIRTLKPTTTCSNAHSHMNSPVMERSTKESPDICHDRERDMVYTYINQTGNYKSNSVINSSVRIYNNSLEKQRGNRNIPPTPPPITPRPTPDTRSFASRSHGRGYGRRQHQECNNVHNSSDDTSPGSSNIDVNNIATINVQNVLKVNKAPLTKNATASANKGQVHGQNRYYSDSRHCGPHYIHSNVQSNSKAYQDGHKRPDDLSQSYVHNDQYSCSQSHSTSNRVYAQQHATEHSASPHTQRYILEQYKDGFRKEPRTSTLVYPISRYNSQTQRKQNNRVGKKQEVHKYLCSQLGEETVTKALLVLEGLGYPNSEIQAKDQTLSSAVTTVLESVVGSQNSHLCSLLVHAASLKRSTNSASDYESDD